MQRNRASCESPGVLFEQVSKEGVIILLLEKKVCRVRKQEVQSARNLCLLIRNIMRSFQDCTECSPWNQTRTLSSSFKFARVSAGLRIKCFEAAAAVLWH